MLNGNSQWRSRADAPSTISKQGLDRETTFSPTNSSKEHLNAEYILQNNFGKLAEDIRHPEKQPTVFERR